MPFAIPAIFTDPKRDKYPLEYYVKLAKELEHRGAHVLAIKDMSGLLKPFAAQKLVKALERRIDHSRAPAYARYLRQPAGRLPLWPTKPAWILWTAPSAACPDFTSQPSLNSLCYALKGTERDPGIDLAALDKLSSYWANVRPMYAQFEAGLQSPDTEIYQLEIPGGQYSNFKPQVIALGLGHRFEEVKQMYSTVNQMLGDIVKVTPSSKMVGDLAIFMVQNHLTPETIVSEGINYNFPDSVVSYFSGMMGQPQGGFPADLQKVVLKGQEPITCRPGELLEPVDFRIRARFPARRSSGRCQRVVRLPVSQSV